MPAFNDRSVDADALPEAGRRLAHATRDVEDPTEIYSVLGSIGLALGSLSQALHQLGAFHDGPASKRAWISGDRQHAAALPLSRQL